MKKQKQFLREKFIEFQLKIEELTKALRNQKEAAGARENKLNLDLIEVLDAFENLNENMEAKKEQLDKSARMLVGNIRSIQTKLIRLLKANGKVQIEFPDNKARMEYCKIVDTEKIPDVENETILSVVKKGYIDKRNNTVLRKAEVITVFNP